MVDTPPPGRPRPGAGQRLLDGRIYRPVGIATLDTLTRHDALLATRPRPDETTGWEPTVPLEATLDAK